MEAWCIDLVRSSLTLCTAALVCFGGCRSDPATARQRAGEAEHTIKDPDLTVSRNEVWYVLAERLRDDETTYLMVEGDRAYKPRLSEVPAGQRGRSLAEVAGVIRGLPASAFVVAPRLERLDVDVRDARVRALTADEAAALRNRLAESSP